MARAEWVERRKGELLPVEYFHVVFTIPELLNPVALANPRVVYRLLMASSARTLETIAADPKHLGARIGFFSILHTWGQNLLHHPHVHCVATGGGLSPDGERWISCRPGFFLPVRVLSALFRRLLLEALKDAFGHQELQFQDPSDRDAFPQLLQQLAGCDWVVYAKPPFGGPARVIDYLGRYTHRVAISNQRLIAADDHGVSFHYKHYRSGDRHQTRRMTLAPEEFIRRFLLHTLPSGFQRIRHYGLFASRNKKTLLELCRLLLAEAASLLPAPEHLKQVSRALAEEAARCPVCQLGRMARIEILPAIRYPAVVIEDSS